MGEQQEPDLGGKPLETEVGSQGVTGRERLTFHGGLTTGARDRGTGELDDRCQRGSSPRDEGGNTMRGRERSTINRS